MTDQTKPETGGITWVLNFIAVMAFVGTFLGGALVNFSVGSEILALVCVSVFSALLWAAASALQEIRNIAFNTRKDKPQ
jgi:phosphate/sulfate permease